MSSTDVEKRRKRPTACIVVGMAGSGKTTFMKRMEDTCSEEGKRAYLINLDPAVGEELLYKPNIDIRDTVNYKKVMEQYKLGPNGAIVTCLNLFATTINEFISILENRSSDLDYIFLDSPGQIEIFTWSASGSIITEALASTFPTVLIYVVDTPRNTSPVTFMSNMLYACSIMYKNRLPFLIVFNKTDIQNHDFAVKWMTDMEAFQDSVRNSESYSATLAKSMGLMLQEFYENLEVCGLSAVSGFGVEEFFVKLMDVTRKYYEFVLLQRSQHMRSNRSHREYIPYMEAAKAKKQKEIEGKSLEKFLEDLKVDSKQTAEEEEEEEKALADLRRKLSEKSKSK